MAEMKKLDPKALIKTGLNKALETQQPVAVANVARLRRVHPEKSPEDSSARLESPSSIPSAGMLESV